MHPRRVRSKRKEIANHEDFPEEASFDQGLKGGVRFDPGRAGEHP